MKNIIVEGHRGYCAKYPENTLISYEAAIDLGVDCFEFDIWLSKDKVPVLMHDQNTRRTCGIDRNLREMTLAEIKKLDAGYAEKFGDKYIGKGVEVPTLRELCELVNAKRPGMPLGVEIKEYTEETVDLSVAMLKEYGLFENAYFYAFDAYIIKYLREKYHARTMGYPDFQMRRFESNSYDYYEEIGIAMNIVKSEIFPIYPKKGMAMHLFCADNEEDVRLCIERGASLITANDPVPLMTVLGRKIGKVKEIE
ncbi:MAG: glycerophosphodiester phosphodiesterase [Clostridia bacterium]|nr:glycerophosphodiester phosphodiesterase [Clostridia bacterium]